MPGSCFILINLPFKNNVYLASTVKLSNTDYNLNCFIKCIMPVVRWNNPHLFQKSISFSVCYENFEDIIYQTPFKCLVRFTKNIKT